MKNTIYIFISLFLVSLFLVNCSAKKGNQISIPTQETQVQDVEVSKQDSLAAYVFESSPVEKKWVDSVYNSLSLEEKIGQLFMVAAYSNKDSAHIKSLDK